MRISFTTYGCKANNLDTDVLYLEAKRRGFEVVEQDHLADFYVINSCTVTENADREARSFALKLKRENPLAKIGVIGCYAQVGKDELLKLPQIDYVVGTANKFSILDYFQKETLERNQVDDAKGFLPEEFLGSRYARASIKIQDGCNFKCSFCIIPQARGKSRSLSIETVVAQYERAKEMGYREVILTGIHLAHYGWDLNTDLLFLLKQLIAVKDGPRIRLTTLDPFEIPDELIALVKNEDRLCPHFHIAIQSGSDKILKSMRRIYKASEFTEVTEKIKNQIPDAFVGVDVIVGFPGEGEAEFEETLQVLQNSYWTKLHVFPFSVRKNTAAETLPDPVSKKDIEERSSMLRFYSEQRYQWFLSTQVGKEKKVVVETRGRGHTENYVPVLLKSSDLEFKKEYPMQLTQVEGERMWASAK